MAGRKGGEVEINNPTVKALLTKMMGSWSGRFMEVILNVEDKKLNLNNVMILVNGRSIYQREGLETNLEDGDKVVFLPPLAGG